GAAGPLPAAATRLLTIANNNSERLVRLVNDILDVEKIESGRIELDFRLLDLRAVVSQAIEANRAFAEKYDARVQLDAASAHPTPARRAAPASASTSSSKSLRCTKARSGSSTRPAAAPPFISSFRSLTAGATHWSHRLAANVRESCMSMTTQGETVILLHVLY